MKYDGQGRELPDPTPIEIPAAMRRQESVNDMMRRMISQELSKHAASMGAETEEEANDFDVDDDVELPYTRAELLSMQLEVTADGDGKDASGDGEEHGANQDRSGTRASERDGPGSGEDDESEDDSDSEADDGRGASDRNRGGKGRDARSKDGAKPRGGRTRREDLEE